MILSISILNTPKFERLRDNNLYIQSITSPINGAYALELSDTAELERLLRKNRIKYTIIR